MADFIKVTQVKSTIAEKKKVRKVCDSMGLGRLVNLGIGKDNNCIRGMVNKINHSKI